MGGGEGADMLYVEKAQMTKLEGEIRELSPLKRRRGPLGTFCRAEGECHWEKCQWEGVIPAAVGGSEFDGKSIIINGLGKYCENWEIDAKLIGGSIKSKIIFF
jgi:hypothetical protein